MHARVVLLLCIYQHTEFEVPSALFQRDLWHEKTVLRVPGLS